MTLESVSISERTFDRLRLPDDALLKTAKRHEETLYKINIAPLVKHTSLSEEFLYWFKHLFLMTFFYDYCLDRSNEEQFPEALFISANMFADYRDFVNHQYGSQGLTTLKCTNAYQVRYQILEKQWLHPSEYFKNFPDYSCYYKKQLLVSNSFAVVGPQSEYGYSGQYAYRDLQGVLVLRSSYRRHHGC